MDEELIKLFKTNRKYSKEELFRILSTYEKEDINNELNKLQLNGTIMYDNDKYQILPNNYKLVNILINGNGCGYFYTNNKLYKIENYNLNGCLNEDLCIVNMDTLKVKKIVERKSKLIVCNITNDNISIVNNNQNYSIKISNNDYKKLVDGNIFLARIKNNDDSCLYCDLVEVIGHVNDPDIVLKQIAISKSFDINFSKEAINEADNIETEVSAEELKNRLDLRDELIYTIDCDESKDMDDAISVKRKENGNYEVGVHIADVSHYVKLGSPLFNEALKRSTSVYMLDTVIPMLMHKLSNGICSLMPNKDRLTISCIAEIDKNGNIVNYDIKKSVINSKKKMNYTSVNKILMENENVEGYENFVDNLKLANEISFILNNKYKESGYLHFGSNEIKYTNNEFKLVRPRAAEKIIEDFMLLANKIVATNFEYIPFAFRVHEMPDNEEVLKVFDNLRKMGFDIPNIQNVDNPKVLQGILKKLYDSGDFSITSFYILKSMKKARYSPSNIGHFGLGFDCYTHFTSPIRRFNDLLVHTIISLYLEPEFNPTKLNDINNNLYQMCEYISQKEILADEAEDEALRFKMAEYMESHIGEYFNGKIIDIHPNYLTVKLENNIKGKVFINDIKGDSYYFDYENFCIKGVKNNSTFKIGDYVRTRILSADKIARTINFKIVENIEHAKQKKLELDK